MATEYLLVDLENVVPGMVSNLSENQIILIFTGSKQIKLHRDLVVSAQPFGKQIQWIVIGGDGRNAADFHIAYYIGVYSGKEPGASFSILSKDKGYDSLIRHLVSRGIRCRRIADIDDFTKPKMLSRDKKNIDEIVADLEKYFIKCDKKTRPKKHAKFMAFVKSRYKLDDDNVVVVKDTMIANKLIEIKDDKILYLVDDLPF